LLNDLSTIVQSSVGRKDVDHRSARYYQVLVFTNENWNAVSTAFALDLVLMYLILGFFFHTLANKEKFVPSGLLKRFRVSRNMDLLASAVFFLSMAPIFYSITAFSFPAEDVIRTMPLRGVLWISVLLLSLGRHATEALWSKFKRPPGSV
jgi:hypothetical protein